MVRNGAKYKYNNLICQFCGKVFNSKTRNKKQKCCDKSCGQKLAVRLGNKPRLFKKGLSSWNKGLRGWRVDYKHSEETKKKIGKANKSRKYLRISPVNELIRKSKRYK